MASTTINLAADVWTNISDLSASGTITHRGGRTEILLVQATNAPSLTPASDNPVANTLSAEDKLKYYSGLVANKIWAYSPVYGSTIVVTPAEV